RDAPFQFRWKTVLDFNHLGTFATDQVMMVSVVALLEQLEPRAAAVELEALDHSHAFEEMHGSINGGQIAVALGQFIVNLANGHGMRMPPQRCENRLPGAGHLARLSAQALGQFRQIPPRRGGRMSMGAVHDPRAATRRDAAAFRSRPARSVSANNPMQAR